MHLKHFNYPLNTRTTPCLLVWPSLRTETQSTPSLYITLQFPSTLRSPPMISFANTRHVVHRLCDVWLGKNINVDCSLVNGIDALSKSASYCRCIGVVETCFVPRPDGMGSRHQDRFSSVTGKVKTEKYSSYGPDSFTNIGSCFEL